jgi:mannosyltransferase
MVALSDFSAKYLRQNIAFFLVVLLASLLSLYELSSKSIWYDEACSITFAQQDVHLLLKHSYLFRPLYFVILKVWIFLLAHDEFSARLLSVLFSIFSIFPLYLMGKQLWGNKRANLIVLVYALSPYRVIISQQIQYYTLFILLGMMSMLFFMEIIHESEKKPYGFYILASLLFLYTHPFALFLIITQNAYMFWFYRNSFVDKYAWLKTQGVLVGGAIPLIIFSQLPAVKSQFGSIPISRQTLMPVLHTLEAFSYGGPFLAQGGNSFLISYQMLTIERIAMILLYGFVISGLVKIIRKRKRTYKNIILIILWAALPLLMVFLASMAKPALYQTRYIAFSLPAFCMLFVLGMSQISQKTVRCIVIFLFCASMLGFLHCYYHGESSQAFRSWREAAHFMRSNIENNDTIVLVPAEQITPFWYYFKATEKKPLRYIGNGRQGQTYYRDHRWHDAFYDNAHQILSLSFHKINYQTDLQWQEMCRDFFDAHFLDSQKNVWIVLSPHWIGIKRAQEMIRLFTDNFELVFDQSFDFDGIEVTYFKKQK